VAAILCQDVSAAFQEASADDMDVSDRVRENPGLEKNKLDPFLDPTLCKATKPGFSYF